MAALYSRRKLLSSCVLLSVVTAGCTSRRATDDTGTAGTEMAATRVTIDDDRGFEPDTIEIELGDTVEWENTAPRMQTVTAYDEEVPQRSEYFSSGGSGREVTARVVYPFAGDLSKGDTYRNTFEETGTYEYFSIPTEGEGTTGTVIVG